MTTSIDTFPDYRKIDTPWEPAPIAWRFISPDTHKNHPRPPKTEFNTTSLAEQANNPDLTHLVREVTGLANKYGTSNYTRPLAKIRDELKIVDDQFAQLEDLTDIKVAPTDWHAFEDSDGYTRILARVEIIEGEDREWPILINSEDPAADSLTPEEYMLLMGFESGINVYTTQARGRQLDDIDIITQYKFGVPRTNLLSKQAFYLIDIEPRLFSHVRNV
jgi:hypothetical protein